MTAHLFFVQPGTLRTDTAGIRVTLDGDEGRHAATVKRIAVGEPILLADGEGLQANGVVVDAARDKLTVEIEAVTNAPAHPLQFTLVQALAKNDRDVQAVEAAVELGVDAVVPWQAERSIVQWKGERAVKAHKKWVAQVRAATKQSRQARVAHVGDLVDRKRLVAMIAEADAALILHEDAPVPITRRQLPEAGNVLLIVGPEGGMSPAEVDAFVTAGGVLTKLGDSVLRSSSAGPAALTALLVRTRWT